MNTLEQKPLISVITVVLNRAETIGLAINSVRSQTYNNIEYLIQDGGSIDGTIQIIETLAPEANFESKPDGGLYEAINTAIARADGDIIGLMHSDDQFASPDILEHVEEIFRDQDVDGIYGDLNYVSSDLSRKAIRKWTAGTFSMKKLARGWMPPHPTLYLRKSVFTQLGGYDSSYRISADYEAMLRWITQGLRLAYLPKTMVIMQSGGESNCSIKNLMRKTREDYKAIKKNNVGGLLTLFLKNFRKINQVM